MSKVLSNRSALQTMIDEVCDIVRSDQFTATLGMLGLHPSVLEANQDGTSTTDGCKLNKLRYDKVCILAFARCSFFHINFVIVWNILNAKC